MVNVEDFAKRLTLMMDYYELNAALLAEKIDVQRSSISHILSGRNKPSLDFVLKILKNFPEVELYWLLNGSGTFPKNSLKKESPTSNSIQKNEITHRESEIKTPKMEEFNNSADIERIVVFYKNGTFKNYIP